MNTIVFVFMYFIVIKSFTIKNPIKHRTCHLCASTLYPLPPSEEDSYEEEIKKLKNNTVSITYKKRKRLLDGYDGRFVENNNTEHAIRVAEEEAHLFMTKFRENYEKLQLLKKLEDTNIPITQKMNMLPSARRSEIRPARINIETLDW